MIQILHKQEVLTNSPKYNYIAGILYPKKTQYDETIDENYKTEEENDLVEEIKEREKHKNEKNIQNDGSENNFDHSIADNEDPIDLTNEIKPSAMGLSVYIETPESLIISIKNVGQYYKVGKKEVIPEETKVIAFYISKFNDDNKSSYKWISKNFGLENSKQNTVENFISEVFNIKKSTFKNNVDYFDKFFDQRAGWYQKNHLLPWI